MINKLLKKPGGIGYHVRTVYCVYNTQAQMWYKTHSQEIQHSSPFMVVWSDENAFPFTTRADAINLIETSPEDMFMFSAVYEVEHYKFDPLFMFGRPKLPSDLQSINLLEIDRNFVVNNWAVPEYTAW